MESPCRGPGSQSSNIVSESGFKLSKGVFFKSVSSKDDLVIISFELNFIVFKVGTALSEESLKDSLVSFVRTGLVHLVSLGLLDRIEAIDLLL